MTVAAWAFALRALVAADQVEALAGWPAELATHRGSESATFDRRIGRLDERWAAAGDDRRPRALRIDIGQEASAPIRFSHSGGQFAASLRIVDAASAPWVERRGVLVSHDGAGDALFVRLTGNGVEDYRIVTERRAGALARYAIDMDRIAGLRKVDNVLEMLDRDGVPRLRMARPYVLDAGGKRFALSVTIEGCNVDESPQPPWGRAVVAPGRASCDVSLALPDDTSAEYPILLDPLWTSTEDMTEPRATQAIRLGDSGRVLLAGGRGESGYLASSELYDEATNTFAVTSSLPEARASYAAGFVAKTGHALISGGCAGSSDACAATAESLTFAPETGELSPVGALTEARVGARGFEILGGRMMIVGGRDAADTDAEALASTEIFDPTTETFTQGPELLVARGTFGGAALADGGIVIVGGSSGATLGNQLSSVERYDPQLDAWLALPDMPSQRGAPSVFELRDGRILVFGGIFFVTPLKSAIVLDASGSWSSMGSLSDARINHAAALLPSGWVVAAGGWGLSTVEMTRLDGPAVAAEWVAVEPLAEEIESPAQVVLPSGRWLVAGGLTDGGQHAVARAQLFEPAQDGAPCSLGGGCVSGQCVDGVCCQSACDAACSVCSIAAGGSADGLCTPIAVGSVDPRGVCIDEGGCGMTGACDPNGACAHYAEDIVCSCDADAVGVCDGNGTCTCSGSVCVDDRTERTQAGELLDCSPFRCSAGACLAECSGSDDCIPSTFCDHQRQCVDAGDLPDPLTACACDLGVPATPPFWPWAWLGSALLWRARLRHSKR